MMNTLFNINFFKLVFIFIKLIGSGALAIIAFLIILAIFGAFSGKDD